jgi:hypothetical protein
MILKQGECRRHQQQYKSSTGREHTSIKYSTTLVSPCDAASTSVRPAGLYLLLFFSAVVAAEPALACARRNTASTIGSMHDHVIKMRIFAQFFMCLSSQRSSRWPPKYPRAPRPTLTRTYHHNAKHLKLHQANCFRRSFQKYTQNEHI